MSKVVGSGGRFASGSSSSSQSSEKSESGSGRSKVSEFKPTKPKRNADGSPLLGSFDPDQMGPEFDVVTELTERRDQYSAGQEAVQTSIRSFPTMCYGNIDRLRASFSGSRPGLNPTVAACLHWGLQTLAADPAVRSFIGVRQRFNSLDPTLDPTIFSIMREIFKDGGLSLESGSRLMLRVPAPVHEEIGTLASDLGLKIETVVGLSVYVTLAEQSSTLKAHVRLMRAEIDGFLRRLGLRARIIGAVMKELELAGAAPADPEPEPEE